MEGILKFNLPEEGVGYLSAINGGKWKAVVWDIDQSLRSKIKYESISDDALKHLEDIRSSLHEFIGSYGLSLDD